MPAFRPVGTVTTSWAYDPAGSTERFSVVGEAGALWSDGLALYHRPRGGEIVELVTSTDQEIDTIALAVQDFVACLREGRRPIHTEIEGHNCPPLAACSVHDTSEIQQRTRQAVELRHDQDGGQP